MPLKFFRTLSPVQYQPVTTSIILTNSSSAVRELQFNDNKPWSAGDETITDRVKKHN